MQQAGQNDSRDTGLLQIGCCAEAGRACWAGEGDASPGHKARPEDIAAISHQMPLVAHGGGRRSIRTGINRVRGKSNHGLRKVTSCRLARQVRCHEHKSAQMH
jgi:hypothetical protein